MDPGIFTSLVHSQVRSFTHAYIYIEVSLSNRKYRTCLCILHIGSRHSLESISYIQLVHMFQFLWAQTGAPGVSEQGAVPAVSDQNATSLDAIVPAVSDQNASNLGPEGKLEKRCRICRSKHAILQEANRACTYQAWPDCWVVTLDLRARARWDTHE